MLNVDGLWTNKMTLHIHRDGAPIPNTMQSEYISLELSAVQMNAIAAVLGLGYCNGELLYYRDEDVKKNIERTDGFGIQANYHFINCDSRRNRCSKRVNKPLVDSSAADYIKACKDLSGSFDFIVGTSSEKDVQPDEQFDPETVESDNEVMDQETANNMFSEAMTMLGISFSAPAATEMEADTNGDGIVDIGESMAYGNALKTGEPDAAANPFSSFGNNA